MTTEIRDARRCRPTADLGKLQLEAPVTFSGRVEAACRSRRRPCSHAVDRRADPHHATVAVPGWPRAPPRRPVEGRRPARHRFVLDPRPAHARPAIRRTPSPSIPKAAATSRPRTAARTQRSWCRPSGIELVADGNIEHQTYTLGHATPCTITGTLKDGLGASLDEVSRRRARPLGRERGARPRCRRSHYSTDGTLLAR